MKIQKPYKIIKQKNKMHEILHIIGLCPDNFTHPDLIDIFIVNYESIISLKPKEIFKIIRKNKLILLY